MSKSYPWFIFLGLMAIALSAGFILGSAPVLGNGKAAWYAARSAGIIAYLLLALSSFWGLATSSRLLMKWVHLPLTTELHKYLSYLALGALSVHGVALLFDKTFQFQLWNIGIPFLSPYRPLQVGMGVISGYLMLLLVVSFFVRKRIGPRAWRLFHYSAFAAFLLGLAHGALSGTDTSSVWMQLVYFLTGGMVLFLTMIRLIGGRYVPSPSPGRRGEEALASMERRSTSKMTFG